MEKYGTNLSLMFLRNGENKISIYSTTPNLKLYEFFSKQLLNYINSFYPDIYLITEEEKAVITHRQGDIKNEFCNQFGKSNTIQKFYEYFIKYKSDTKPLSELKYVLVVDNNFENIKKLALQLNKKEVRK